MVSTDKLTIIPRACVGYEMVAYRRLLYKGSISESKTGYLIGYCDNKVVKNVCFVGKIFSVG